MNKVFNNQQQLFEGTDGIPSVSEQLLPAILQRVSIISSFVLYFLKRFTAGISRDFAGKKSTATGIALFSHTGIAGGLLY